MLLQGLEIDILPTLVPDRRAARFVEFGLTAYSDDEFVAVRKLELMLEGAILAHRENGTLEEWLNRSGVKWREFEPI